MSNTFIVFNKESTAKYFENPTLEEHRLNNIESWVWAYDANFVPDLSAPTDTSEEKYQGRLRVSLSCLFTWFYAVRATEKYTMKQLWEKAQTQLGKRWYVEAQGGAYHSPLVLLEPGTTRGNFVGEL